MSKGGIAPLNHFLNQTEFNHSRFDVGCSMLDVHQFHFLFDWLLFRPAAVLNPERLNLHPLLQQFQSDAAVGFDTQCEHVLVKIKFRIMDRNKLLLPHTEGIKTPF